MQQEQFLQLHASHLGPIGIPVTLHSVQLAGLLEALIKKGIITREEVQTETENQFLSLSNTIKMTPRLSPFQPQK